MDKLSYASCLDSDLATCILFGANTKGAGTAPTFSTSTDRDIFSADFIRKVDNLLFSLPENFKTGDRLWDAGNLILPKTRDREIESVTNEFQRIFSQKKIPICLGGDHIIKYAALNALDNLFPEQYGVVYVDAHPDCESQEILSYASILHHGFLLPWLKPWQVMLLGIRQFTASEAMALNNYPDIGIIKGAEFASINPADLLEKIAAQFANLKYIYFSIDLDGLSPSCSPAVESPYPGGPNLNQILYLIQNLRKKFNYIGMDISEFIPKLDNNRTTALSAARIMKEFYSVI
jgi:arginase family enzyme